MKRYKYEVWFANCNYEPECVVVEAFSANDALILAQVERIEDGKDYTLDAIKLIK